MAIKITEYKQRITCVTYTKGKLYPVTKIIVIDLDSIPF